MSICEGEHLECKKCGKWYESLDHLLYHILNHHTEVFKGNKFKISAEFLLISGYVFDEFDDEQKQEDYVLEVKHEVKRKSISKHWEDIESEVEFDYYQEVLDKIKPSHKEVETEVCDEELNDSEDLEAVPANALGNERYVDNYPVGREQGYECEKCTMIYESKSSLKAHMSRYHEEVNQCRFCPFKACLAEVLDHMGRNCEVEESSDKDNEEIGENIKESTYEESDENDEEYEEREESFSLTLIKCQACDHEEVGFNNHGYGMFCTCCVTAVVTADDDQLYDLKVKSSDYLDSSDTQDVESSGNWFNVSSTQDMATMGADVVMESAQGMDTMGTDVVLKSAQDILFTMGIDVMMAQDMRPSMGALAIESSIDVAFKDVESFDTQSNDSRDMESVLVIPETENILDVEPRYGESEGKTPNKLLHKY